MRQALCYSFPLAQYAQGGDLPDSYEYADSIIPGAARLYDESYTDLTAKGFSLGSVTYPDGSSTSDFRRSDQLTITYNARAAAAALEQVKELPQGLTLLLPKGSALEGFCGWLQKQWLDHLGLVVNLAIVDADTYRSRLAKGILPWPCTATPPVTSCIRYSVTTARAAVHRSSAPIPTTASCWIWPAPAAM